MGEIVNAIQQVQSALVVLVVAACGGNTTTPSAAPVDLTGSFSGVVSSSAEGMVLEGLVTLEISQSRSTLSGSSVVQGVLRSGGQVLPLYGTGPLRGSVASGHNPSVTVRVRSSQCPAVEETLTGSFDQASGQLRLSGAMPVLSLATCTPLVTFRVSLTMTR